MSTKAIFLDRDGVLISNKEHYYIWKPSQMNYVDGVFENLLAFTSKGFHLFIVSNQGGISKGLYSKNDILQLHNKLIQDFRKNQIEIKEIAFCPHHPEIENCLCRKPSPLMIEKLVAKYKLSRTGSYLVGDSATDMEAAQKAGIQGIRVTPNQNMFPFISFLIK